MFSIAAINESDSGGQWEPLAPTKEAQEFALSQKYHEGLLKLQQKNYAKARELLEDVLKDPLISNIQVDNTGSDQHLLQLRFLTLKNLASVFRQQGLEFYDNALHCYLQAVELDANDSVVWNHLGTLSCSMGLLSVSRWAFEQGLQCSPNNWNCMEKLLEVLIAIRDEVACLSVANLLLRNWPSHHRALHVKKTIEDTEPVPFAPRGIDILEPKHVTLNISNKRKSGDDEIHQETRMKKSKQNATLQLNEAKWMALLDGILSFLSANNEKADGDNCTNTAYRCLGIEGSVKGLGYNMIDVVISTDTFKTVESAAGNGHDSYHDGESVPSHDCKTTVKEKDANSDREHPHERRSTRLERLRSRKSGKDENGSDGKDISHAMTQFLDSFILKGPSAVEKTDCSGNAHADTLIYTSDDEANDVKLFLCKISKNFGPHHIGYMLLEEMAHLKIPFQDYFVKFIELEKLTRGWAYDRSALCSLFLAELYYDLALCSGSPSTSSELSDSSYHVCKIIESVALELPFNTPVGEMHSTNLNLDIENSSADVSSSDRIEKNASHVSKSSENSDKPVSSNMLTDEKSECDSSSDMDCAFWVRCFWLRGCLSLASDCKERAFKQFNIALSILTNINEAKNSEELILLPHTKLVKLLTADRILREINLIRLESLLWNNDENINKITHTEFMKLLPPLLLSTRDVYVGNAYGPPRESENVISLELSALDVLISACEKAKPMDIQVYLDSHRRKIQVLTVAAGMIGSVTPPKGKGSSDVDFVEAMNRNRLENVVEAVKDVSRNASKAKEFIDQCDNSDGQDGWSSLISIVGDIQSLLLTIMCAAVKMILSRKFSCFGTSYQVDQLESSCLVDAAIAFCKLQHLDPTISIKTQVDLIVAVHDLLAEYGLCCAGRDGEGEEGTFLKFAIKHLMALDVKLKSQLNPNGVEEDVVPKIDGAQDRDEPSVGDSKQNSEDEEESELDEIQSCIDSALDQAFFCLYGLKINPDSCSEDDLAVHKNTSRGDYQTKEQCADVFQYVLPYAKALSKTGLVKLRRVLRAIRKHFTQPPYDLLVNNPIDNFLDGTDSCEKMLSEIYETNGSREAILNVLFPGERGYEAFKKLSTASSEPYSDVYGNLYYYIAQAEDLSATDKYTGFVLKKEGEEFVEQSANLFKYDLLYNPLRFESWQKLSNLYDEEVDLLLNDGSKHISILDWRMNTTLIQRVEMGRRHSRRCLLMSLALAKTAPEQSETHELLALVYYDSLQNVVPFYDQRATLPVKDSTWETFCQNSMKHFEKAFEIKAQWLNAFYLGKLCEKLGHSFAKAFSYYNKAVMLNPTAVDPVYRIHASRMKLLYTQGKQNLKAIQVVADYTYNQSTKENVLSMLGSIANVQHSSSDHNEKSTLDSKEENKFVEPDLLDKVWHILYDDCLYALGTCVEGELKHFHKARYKLAQGLYRRDEAGDLERAKEELSFCFKSSRSSFTVNMWEIDGTVRKGRRKNPNVGGSRKNLEVSLSESSRKFITCIRKYMILYLNLLEKNRDLWTLEKAYTYLRTDKRFALCLGDIVPVGLGKYLQVLTAAIRNPEIRRASGDAPVEQLLEKMFSVFMDHANLWADISTIPEVNCPELSESDLYSYIHQYIHMLESDIRLDVLEGLNEKIRKRFKTPKLSSSNFAKICKHASLAWCRCILIKLASITPLTESMDATDQPGPLSNGLLLYVDLQPDELLISSPDGPARFKGLDMNWFETLNRIKNIPIKQTSEDNLEIAVTVMKSTYNFYRESSCGTFPSGIHMYTVTPSQAPIEGLPQAPDVVDTLDLSIPRKLLLWVYTLVHGRYSNISSVVKYCDEMKARNKRGNPAASASSQVVQPMPHSTASSQAVAKEKSAQVESTEAVHASNPSASAVACAPLHQEVGGTSTLQTAIDVQKTTATASQLTRSSSSRGMENTQDGGETK
ncbi:calcineurin-binding protein 1-like isoform X1 [Phragmites australis]|uniref:calcineurin-binding protein 1-like isoform X1 n=1 Tax=Phragmites australis TaxID=29695 RepID=UPI002D78EBB1|nr:calcineurin-binding protein 1-like isoform X1 [Phragmites australis]